MKSIKADWVRYNANTNNKRVGDCVKRAISFAYGVDYDEISRQLNLLKRRLGGDKYNDTYVFTRFLDDQGAIKLDSKTETGMTVEEFSDKHPSGVYLLLCGPQDQTYSTHMVCILNGDIIDSWNSSSYKVNDAWEVKDRSLDVYSVSCDDVVDELNAYIDEYIKSVNDKYDDWFICSRKDGHDVDDTTYRMQFIVETENLPTASQYYSNSRYRHYIVIKLNPRFDVQQNIDSLKPKLKEKLYNWLYNFEKDRKDTLAIKDMNLKYEKRFTSSEKKDILKLPEWVREHVRDFYINPSPRSDYDNFELLIDPLPDDPRSDEHDSVRFTAESLTELKHMLDSYKKDYSRPGWDY